MEVTLTTKQLETALKCCIDPVHCDCKHVCPLFEEVKCRMVLIEAIETHFENLEKTSAAYEKTHAVRPSKTDYYLDIALSVAKRSTCIRRQYGAVIVKDDVIISTGYNGSARNQPNCCDTGVCQREEQHVPHGERYELCNAVHAEANAILNGNRAEMIGATLYLAGFENGQEIDNPTPCLMCMRLIQNARIGRVVTRKGVYMNGTNAVTSE